MTRATNARIAGFTFLVYIAAGITSMVLFRRAASGEGIAAKLAAIAAHATDVGSLVILGLIQCFSALVLAVTLYAIIRDQDGDLGNARAGVSCRRGCYRGPLHPRNADTVLARYGERSGRA